MNKARTAKLERAGWKLGTPKEFLGLAEEEAALIEIKLALAGGNNDGSVVHCKQKEAGESGAPLGKSVSGLEKSKLLRL